MLGRDLPTTALNPTSELFLALRISGWKRKIKSVTRRKEKKLCIDMSMLSIKSHAVGPKAVIITTVPPFLEKCQLTSVWIWAASAPVHIMHCTALHFTTTFFGPSGTRFARCHFRAQKSLDFQGPPLPMALKIEFPASKSLRPAPYKTGTSTLIVKLIAKYPTPPHWERRAIKPNHIN